MSSFEVRSYATDGECQDKANGLSSAGKIDGYECYAEGRGHALDVHYKCRESPPWREPMPCDVSHQNQGPHPVKAEGVGIGSRQAPIYLINVVER